jgi:hypothetical protein
MQMPKPPGSGKSPMVDPKSAPIAHVLTICVARSNPIGVPLGAVSARKALRATGGVLIFFGVAFFAAGLVLICLPSDLLAAAFFFAAGCARAAFFAAFFCCFFFAIGNLR